MKYSVVRNVVFDFFSCILAGGVVLFQVRMYLEFGRVALAPSAFLIGVCSIYSFGIYLSYLAESKMNAYERASLLRKQSLADKKEHLQRRTDLRRIRVERSSCEHDDVEQIQSGDDDQNNEVQHVHSSSGSAGLQLCPIVEGDEFDIPITNHGFDSRSGKVQPVDEIVPSRRVLDRLDSRERRRNRKEVNRKRNASHEGGGVSVNDSEHHSARTQTTLDGRMQRQIKKKSISLSSQPNARVQARLDAKADREKRIRDAPPCGETLTLPPLAQKKPTWNGIEEDTHNKELNEQLNSILANDAATKDVGTTASRSKILMFDDVESDDSVQIEGEYEEGNSHEINHPSNHDVAEGKNTLFDSDFHSSVDDEFGWVDSVLASCAHLSVEDSSITPSINTTTTIASKLSEQPCFARNERKFVSNLLKPAPTAASLKGTFRKQKEDLKNADEIRNFEVVNDEDSSIVSAIAAPPRSILGNLKNVDNAFYMSPTNSIKQSKSSLRSSPVVVQDGVAAAAMIFEDFESDEDDDDSFKEKISLIDSVLSTLDEPF